MIYFKKAIIFTAFLLCCVSTHSQTLYLYSELPNTKIEIKDSVYAVYSHRYYKDNDAEEAKIKFSKRTPFLRIKIFQNDTLLNDTTVKFDRFKMRNSVVDTLGNIKFYRNLSKLFSNKYAEWEFYKYKKHSVNALISIPEINAYNFDIENENRINQAGFLGIGLGIEYFYKDNKSIQLRGDGIWSFIAPIPAPYDPDRYNSWKTCGAWNMNLTDNFSLKRFQLGYGLNYARNIWNARGYYSKQPDELAEGKQAEFIDGVREVHQMLGFTLQANYRLGNFYYLGAIYRPSFFQLSKPKFTYEHSISIEFLMKFVLKSE